MLHNATRRFAGVAALAVIVAIGSPALAQSGQDGRDGTGRDTTGSRDDSTGRDGTTGGTGTTGATGTIGGTGTTARDGAVDKDGQTSSGVDQQKQAFSKFVLEKLHGVNQKEIALGQIAQQRGTLKETKDLAQMIVTHHSKADEQLVMVAQQQGVLLDRATTLPAGMPRKDDASGSGSSAGASKTGSRPSGTSDGSRDRSSSGTDSDGSRDKGSSGTGSGTEPESGSHLGIGSSSTGQPGSGAWRPVGEKPAGPGAARSGEDQAGGPGERKVGDPSERSGTGDQPGKSGRTGATGQMGGTGHKDSSYPPTVGSTQPSGFMSGASEGDQICQVLKQVGKRVTQEEIQALQKLQGVEFDRAYAQCMVGGHTEAIAFVTAVRDQVDPSIRAHLDELLPQLEHHKKQSEEALKAASKQQPGR